ncbi:translation initiation factor IF-2 [Thermosediminibacter oceani]|uniref:Translation initiation factor IF-2 n=1 Tax=Thermosediminibacter oceani (strain ATCC BAA-1034 / DSM 16646 / JW/IW-1228P) TaxID=555079 RepID=D9S3L6_THEOJ|nr:translation initiation factor IF-2 [Thermosediminibacter oceani]ADL07993.1 bacterial translation initiation factor 2 (bIF-2) [Thermosediminibacter oceani DSM 16646]
MSKIRVYELAKKLGISSKKLISILEDLDVEIKNHMSSLEDDMAQLIMDLVSEEKGNKKTKTDKKEINNKDVQKSADLPKKSEEENKPRVQKVVLPSKISIQDLGTRINIEPVKLIRKLMDFGLMVNINAEIDFESAKKLVKEFGYEAEEENQQQLLNQQEEEQDRPEDLKPRPPVVTVMGHVDHGKTTLLDAIRETKVAALEAGGITQHIGASQIEKDGKTIVFLDTPGHEAFTALRARGAKVTDIVVLVVAADDGVMPQTVEAINHAKAAGVPIIVAVNKIDKPNANPERVKQQLTEYGLIPEEWGGDTIFVNVSAKNRIGIDQLLEMILLVAEMAELKANYNRKAVGVIIEAKLDKGRGPVATVLVQKGTLRVGDAIVAGSAHGKVRAMLDSRGKLVKSAGPSIPVEVMGFSEVPNAGDILKVVSSEKEAREIAEKYKEIYKEKEMVATPKVSLDRLFDKIKQGEVKDLHIILKADVQGSLEALKQSLEKCSTDQVQVKIIHGGVGAINESDILLASASNAIVIGFNVRPDSNAKKLAEQEDIDIRTYRVIYDVVDDIQAAMKGLLEPEYKEVVLGRAEVRALFKVPNVGTVAGCYVTEGKITRNSTIRVIRQGVVVYEGKILSLKRFKDDVREVMSGFECGIAIEKFNDLKEGDVLEAFINKRVDQQ